MYIYIIHIYYTCRLYMYIDIHIYVYTCIYTCVYTYIQCFPSRFFHKFCDKRSLRCRILSANTSKEVFSYAEAQHSEQPVPTLFVSGDLQQVLPWWFTAINPCCLQVIIMRVMTNIANWKIPTINGGFVRWRNHLFLWAMASMANQKAMASMGHTLW